MDVLVLDLGRQPLADALIGPGDLLRQELLQPLRLLVCTNCWLVQLGSTHGVLFPAAVHGHGTAFSSTALAHARTWTNALIEDLGLGPTARVLDIASGDGLLLEPFAQRGMRVLGLEPDPATAAASRAPTRCANFGDATARDLVDGGFRADLVLVNHALAHADDLGDMVSGLELVLAPGGVLAIEFHHVLGLLQQAQFDIVCHAHKAFLSLLALEGLLAPHNLTIVDAQLVALHGGSVRVLARRSHDGSSVTRRTGELREVEREAGLDRVESYLVVGAQADRVRRELVTFLDEARAANKSVVAYGAPSRGITLLNYCRLSTDSIAFTVDRAPHKQGRFLPGCRIPVHAPAAILEARPDYLLILAWTLADEITQQMCAIRTWGGRFVVALPELRVLV